MKQINIGTCIKGRKALEWIPAMMDIGYECVAINFHMSTGDIDIKELAPKVLEKLGDSGVYVSSIGYYCNPLQSEEQRKTLEYFIDCAHDFGTDMVSTFAGAIEGDSVPSAIPRFKEVFGELCRRAEDRGVRIAIENCPMDGTWRSATCNIGFNPRAWEMMFDAVPSDALGLEWEPGHQQIQLIDPLPQLREWAPKIIHLHGKDASVDEAAIRRYGILGAAEFAPQRTPGFGDLNWTDIFSILHRAGYEGDICVEGYHDPIYRGEWETTAQIHAYQYLKWCRGGDFAPNTLL